MHNDSDRKLDYQRLMKLGRRAVVDETAPVIRLAILADCATQQLALLVKALLSEAGFRAEVYEGAFGAIEIEACTPTSALYGFAPDVILLLGTTQALVASFGRSQERAIGFAAAQGSKTVGVWDAIRSRSGALILQATYPSPSESPFGNFDLKVPESLRSNVSELNAFITKEARERSGVLLLDVEWIASWVGRQNFFDYRAWDLWKIPCALDHLPQIAKNVADVLLASRGRVIKCVVADLDNTLWGGVIGDDGLEGIELGAHDGGAGEAFVRLQLFLKQLKNRGIMLAVCSKNVEQTALLPFLHHPEMILKRDDISVFVANWEDKASGIRRIREELNIGFDAMVFLDDNPFERDLVRKLLPEVVVPELPEDPSLMVAYLSRLNLFETTSFSVEDAARTVLYQRESQRRAAAAASSSVEDYLQSLDMQMVVSRFDPFHLPRISQLMARSNQFNLCTRRLSEPECKGLMDDPNYLPLYASLTDKFGNHGLIAVIVLQPAGETLLIRDWLMSCRVLARGVEQRLMNYVVAYAAKEGLTRLRGEYIPTPKNGMVSGFFESFGFARETAQGTQWTLRVGDYHPRETAIHLKCPEEAVLDSEDQ